MNFYQYHEGAHPDGSLGGLVDPSLGKGLDWDFAGPQAPVGIGGVLRVGGSLGNRPVPPLSCNSQTPRIQKIKIEADAPILQNDRSQHNSESILQRGYHNNHFFTVVKRDVDPSPEIRPLFKKNSLPNFPL